MDRLVIISADCHATARPDEYDQYMDPEFRDDYVTYRNKLDEIRAIFDKSAEEGGRLFSRKAIDEYKKSDGVDADVTGGTSGQWDSALRTKELEADGVVAEVLFPNGSPFMAGIGADVTPAHQAAGVRAYNRWLADFCADLPGRRAGIAQIPLDDIPASVAEIESAAKAGLKGVMLPMGRGQDYPALYHERYEPVWAACESNGLPVHVHQGGGTPAYEADGLLGTMLYLTEIYFYAQRPLYFLMWGGVFERHPELKFVMSENLIEPLAPLIDRLDRSYTGAGLFDWVKNLIPRSPREYWDRQCYVNASFLANEQRERDAVPGVGVDKIMWGSDYPHIEGSWPNSRKRLASGLAGMSVDHATRILGATAADVYGFDIGALEKVAATVGPSHQDLSLV